MGAWGALFRLTKHGKFLNVGMLRLAVLSSLHLASTLATQPAGLRASCSASCAACRAASRAARCAVLCVARRADDCAAWLSCLLDASRTFPSALASWGPTDLHWGE